MKIFLINNNHYPIIIQTVDNSVNINPFETKTIETNEDEVEFLLKHSYESYIPKNSKIYHLVIYSKYNVAHVTNGAKFYVDREKMRFTAEAFYDRLFLSTQDALIVAESHTISAEDKIKNNVSRNQRMNRFLIAPIEQSTGLCVFGIIIGVVLLSFLGWEFAVVYFPALYLFLVLLNWIIDRFWIHLEKKITNEKQEKNLDLYFTNEFIKDFYSNPLREPFMGDIEIN